MITEQQQEQAALFVLGRLGAADQERFASELRQSPELREFVRGLQGTMDKVALSVPAQPLPPGLKTKVLARVQAAGATAHSSRPGATLLAEAAKGLSFIFSHEASGWKQLPVPGAWIKLLSFEPQRGYAVVLGRLDPGVRYPAHTNTGPEDFYILTGDLHVSNRKLGPGDFHHADAGSAHEENYSVEGCTLLAVLTVDDPLVAFARA